MQTGNMAAGNAGYALYVDILVPIMLICLLIAYKATFKKPNELIEQKDSSLPKST